MNLDQEFQSVQQSMVIAANEMLAHAIYDKSPDDLTHEERQKVLKLFTEFRSMITVEAMLNMATALKTVPFPGTIEDGLSPEYLAGVDQTRNTIADMMCTVAQEHLGVSDDR